MVVNILGLLAAVALGVSAWFAWETKGNLEAQIQTIANEEARLKDTQQKNTDTRNEIKINEETLAEKNSEREGLEGDLAKQNEVLEEIESAINDQKLVVDQKREELNAVKQDTADEGTVNDLLADVKEFQSQVVELDTKIATATSTRNSLDNTSAGILQYNTGKKSEIDLYSSGSSISTLNTSIAQVYNSHGYVTIKGGDSVGIIKGSTLDVVRGTKTIAKLFVTTVEPGSAAANIIPSSLSDSTSIIPGDRVISGSPITPSAN